MAEPRKPTGRYITWMRSMGFSWSRRLRVWVCGAAKYNRDGTIKRDARNVREQVSKVEMGSK